MTETLFAQVVINIEQWQIFAPIVVIGALLGWTRGWREMAIFFVATILAIFIANGLRVNIPPILQRLTNIGRLLGPAVTDPSNSPVVEQPAQTEVPWISDTRNEPLIMIGFFLFLALLGYVIAKALGTRGNLGLFGRIGGSLFGAAAFTVVLWQMLGYWVNLNTRRAGENVPLTDVVSSPQVNITVPGVSVPGLPTTNILDSWVFWAVGAAVLAILVIALRRSPKAAG